MGHLHVSTRVDGFPFYPGEAEVLSGLHFCTILIIAHKISECPSLFGLGSLPKNSNPKHVLKENSSFLYQRPDDLKGLRLFGI